MVSGDSELAIYRQNEAISRKLNKFLEIFYGPVFASHKVARLVMQTCTPVLEKSCSNNKVLQALELVEQYALGMMPAPTRS